MAVYYLIGVAVMRFKYLIISVFCLSLCAVSGGEAGAKTERLKIYLLREVVTKDEMIDLATIGIVRGEDIPASRAGGVGLGRFSLAGQEIVIDRATILGRLASSGIDTEGVVISGAERVTVRREEAEVSGDEYVEVAREFLRKQLKGSSVCKITAISKPQGKIISKNNKDFKLVPRMSKYSTASCPKVWVGFVLDEVEQGGCDIAFSLKYNCRSAVATVDIGVGSVLNAENVKIETSESPRPEDKGWVSPYGMIAKRAITKGTVVRGDIAGPAEMPVVIKRRQTVLVKVETAGFYVSSFGEAMEDGKVDQFIRVKMNGGRESKTIIGKVGSDGSVRPVI